MGCDIHVYVEQYDTYTKKWYARDTFEQTFPENFDVVYPYEHHVEPLHQRDYAVFAWLAGVRNSQDIVPLREPRGVPRDMSMAVQLCHDSYADGHTHSYLSAREILEAKCDDEQSIKYLDGTFTLEELTREFIETVRALTHKFEAVPENLRLVFWFDN